MMDYMTRLIIFDPEYFNERDFIASGYSNLSNRYNPDKAKEDVCHHLATYVFNATCGDDRAEDLPTIAGKLRQVLKQFPEFIDGVLEALERGDYST